MELSKKEERKITIIVKDLNSVEKRRLCTAEELKDRKYFTKYILDGISSHFSYNFQGRQMLVENNLDYNAFCEYVIDEKVLRLVYITIILKRGQVLLKNMVFIGCALITLLSFNIAVAYTIPSVFYISLFQFLASFPILIYMHNFHPNTIYTFKKCTFLKKFISSKKRKTFKKNIEFIKMCGFDKKNNIIKKALKKNGNSVKETIKEFIKE